MMFLKMTAKIGVWQENICLLVTNTTTCIFARFAIFADNY
jgi:hypothetical protein